MDDIFLSGGGGGGGGGGVTQALHESFKTASPTHPSSAFNLSVYMP